jgi:hypothetical protein
MAPALDERDRIRAAMDRRILADTLARPDSNSISSPGRQSIHPKD